MKKIFIAFSLFILSCSFLYSEFKWVRIEPWEDFNVSTDRFNNIECIDSLYCIMLSSKLSAICRLYASNDGGFTWSKFYDEEPGWDHAYPAFVYNMAWPSKNYIYLTYEYGHIKRSTDRGKTFETVSMPFYPHPQLASIDHIYMLDSVNGIAAAPWYDLYTTTDGWITYTKHENTPHGGRRHVWMFSPENYAFLSAITSEVACFVKTTDNGTTWNVSKLDYMGAYAMHFVNEDIGYIVGSETDEENTNHSYDVIHKTTDGGETWFRVYTKKDLYAPFGLSDPQNSRSVCFYDEMNGIAVGNWNKVLRTKDGGETWMREFIGDEEHQSELGLNIYYIGSDAVIYSVYSKGSLHRLYDPDYKPDTTETSVIHFNNTHNNINVYPNPFIESVSFAFSYQLAGEQINISIYDILGNLLETQTFTYYPNMGELQYTPKNNTSTGVYFYRITIGENEYTGSLFKK